jgi:toxin FitB
MDLTSTRWPQGPACNRVFSSVSPGEIVTSVATLCEVYKKLKPLKGESSALSAVVHLHSATLVPFVDQLALEAADYSLSMRLQVADAVIYATAQRFGAQLHTSEPELRGKSGVVFH